MPLESAQTLEQLDRTYPLNGDPASPGAAHLRLIKQVLQNIFAGANGAGYNTVINAVESELLSINGLVAGVQSQIDAININNTVIGSLFLYSGLFANIPANFQVCDGTNGTPDLHDLFMRGTDIEVNVGVTGGSADTVIPAHTHDADHGHTAFIDLDGQHSHAIGGIYQNSFHSFGMENATVDTTTNPLLSDSKGAHTHPISLDDDITPTTTAGVALAQANIPTWVKMVFIQRMS